MKNWLIKYNYEISDDLLSTMNFPVGCLKNINVYENYRGEGYGNEIFDYFMDDEEDEDGLRRQVGRAPA